MIDTSATLLLRIMYARIPAPDCGAGCRNREYRFSTRRWRFDFAWLHEKVALELEGGVSDRHRGRHIRADGYQRDIEKYDAATAEGWEVFRVTTKDVQEFTPTLQSVLEAIRARIDRSTNGSHSS